MDIHRCRFVPYPPSAINALAFSHASPITNSGKTPSTPSTLRLALGRANGDIEIWNPSRGLWYQESVLRGGKDRSIEGLVWVQDPENVDEHGYKIPGKLRLFSIGYSTSVTEWDLAESKPKRHSGGNYGEIWCMAVQPKPTIKPGKQITDGETAVQETQSVSVGCADGAIVLLSTEDSDLRFTKLVARSSKKGARVLSITFQNRSTLVAGHADSTIRIYNLRNGQQLRNMTLGAGPKGGPRETLVWTVRCPSDGSIISGDSTGTVCFWDGKTYALLQRIKAHDADILDITVSADGQSAFSGGMDRRTVCYKRSGGGKLGGKSRWAKVSHSRMHEHDVKAMTAFESKGLSILASGGLDTNPIIVPIQQFGKEHHRTLSSLPQQPSLLSVPRKRLVISWWDREISLWTVSRRRTHHFEGEEDPEPQTLQGRKLIAKIALTGDESISSVSIDSTGTLLVVSTITSTKIFRLLPRKDRTLKVQKLTIPSCLAQSGAKLLQFSPDSKWLSIILPTDRIQLYKLIPSNPKEPQVPPGFLKRAIKLNRLPRTEIRTKQEHGTLGTYDRSINRVAFSADSSILAVSDLSGYLDTWVLEGHEDLTQADPSLDSIPENSDSSSSSSSSDDSDSESDNEPSRHEAKSARIIYGQHWIPSPTASLLPKLPSTPLVLSFRPSQSLPPTNTTTTTQQAPTPPATRHNPHPHSHTFPRGEDRLLVITAGNKILEFDILTGRLSDWSRRNPPSVFPERWQGLRDQARGVVWDVARERVWVWGVSWLWMFDMGQDLRTEHHLNNGRFSSDIADGGGGETNHKPPPTTALMKRKRREGEDEEDAGSTQRRGTGAGSLIPASELKMGIGRKMRRIEAEDGEAGKTKMIDLDYHHGIADAEGEDEDDDEEANAADSAALVTMRRSGGAADTEWDAGDGEEAEEVEGDDAMDDAMDIDGDAPGDAGRTGSTTAKTVAKEGKHHGKAKAQTPSYWHTFKYRPILGIVALGGPGGGEGARGDEDVDEGGAAGGGIEVALVERPLWEVDLPARFYGAQEWDQ